MPLALRLSGQLLLGVVRIYARKLDFLQRDSAEALVKIRQVRAMAFGRARCILAHARNSAGVRAPRRGRGAAC